MKKVHLKNPTENAQLSLVLAEFFALAESQGMQVDSVLVPNNTKGELIREVIIAVGGGVAINAIYDMLKYSLNRLIDSLPGDTPIEIDEKLTTVEEIRKASDSDK